MDDTIIEFILVSRLNSVQYKIKKQGLNSPGKNEVAILQFHLKVRSPSIKVNHVSYYIIFLYVYYYTE